MTIEERIEHLANITFLLDYHDKFGGAKSKKILAEWNYHNAELFKQLDEVYDEAGNRKNDGQRAEAGADQPRDQSERSGTDRSTNQQSTASPVISRPGYRST